MTLEELETALREPTPELINELNKRVHIKATKCGNDHQWTYLGEKHYPFYHDVYSCMLCELQVSTYDKKGPPPKESIENPDYTRPENFWPLAWKNDITVIKVQQSGFVHTFATNDVKAFFIRSDEKKQLYPVMEVWVVGDRPGIAVCLAFLKVMEDKDEAA